MQRLHVRLKFPDAGKATKTTAFTSLFVEPTSLTVEAIRQSIHLHDQFQEEIHSRKLDLQTLDFRFLCRGRELSNANLPAQILLADSQNYVLAKIIAIPSPDAHHSAPCTPQPRNADGSAGSDLTAFRKFLLEQNSALLDQFFEGGAVRSDIQGTLLHRIASKKDVLFFSTESGEKVDSISHCINRLTNLHTLREECVTSKKTLNKEELDIQKYIPHP